MNYKEFEEKLIEYAQGRKFLKEQAMIFQRDSKIAAAKAFGQSFDAYFNLSYAEWSKISMDYIKKQEEVMVLCQLAGISDTMPYSSFPLYRKLMGLN